MKQTAVEWLIDMLVTENEITLKGENFKLFDHAKEMEKQQIIEAHGNKLRKSRGAGTSYDYWVGGIDYYNETFKS
jgi:hypothetical protein